MWDFVLSGGWMMWPILLCAVLTLTIVVERYWSLRRPYVIPAELSTRVMQWAEKGKLDPAHISELRQDSSLSRVLVAAFQHRFQSRDRMKEAVEDSGRHEIHRMERFIELLGTIAALSPLLGLLGTVIGMIDVFAAIMTHGVGKAGYLAGGISQALITTAAGLSVAIPAYFFYRQLHARVESYVMEMEELAMAMIDTMEKSTPKVK